MCAAAVPRGALALVAIATAAADPVGVSAGFVPPAAAVETLTPLSSARWAAATTPAPAEPGPQVDEVRGAVLPAPGRDEEDVAGAVDLAARPFPPTNPAAYLWWLLILYMFYVMAVVCDNYLVPTVDLICERFSIPEDVAGATLMAFACNGPELLTNTCAIFITESSVGMGTIVGSAIFNVMVIVGVCPIVTQNGVLDIPKNTFLRDAGFSAVSIVILYWALPVFTYLHASVLFFMTFVYVVVVAKFDAWFGGPGPEDLQKLEEKILAREEQNRRVRPDFAPRTIFRRMSHDAIGRSAEAMWGEVQPQGRARTLSDVEYEVRYKRMCPQVSVQEAYTTGPGDRKELWTLSTCEETTDEVASSPSMARRLLECVWSILSWPTTFVLYMTIPDVRIESKKRRYVAAFFLSMAWLSATAFVVCLGSDSINRFWGIPQSFLGLTLAAVGTSFPNMFASMVTAKQGRGPIAVSNALGSNVQNVFLVLSLPIWVRVLQKGEYIMGGDDIDASIIWMAITLGYCVVVVAASGWQLTASAGWSFIVLYLVYVVQTTVCA